MGVDTKWLAKHFEEKEARMSNEPRCARCGHPRSNHPYRHPFVGPSWDDTIKTQADRIEELISERDEAWKRAAHAEKMWGEAEAKLAKANALILDMIECSPWRGEPLSGFLARYTELTGGKNG